MRWLKAATCGSWSSASAIAATTLAVMSCRSSAARRRDRRSIGREFMPELEEGNLWIRGIFPVNIDWTQVADQMRRARAIIGQLSGGRVDRDRRSAGPTTAPTRAASTTSSIFVPLKPQKDWPELVRRTGWRRWSSHTRGRSGTHRRR